MVQIEILISQDFLFYFVQMKWQAFSGYKNVFDVANLWQVWNCFYLECKNIGYFIFLCFLVQNGDVTHGAPHNGIVRELANLFGTGPFCTSSFVHFSRYFNLSILQEPTFFPSSYTLDILWYSKSILNCIFHCDSHSLPFAT